MSSVTSSAADNLRVDLHGAFIRRTDLSFANLRDANFAGADAAHANFRGADFEGANLDGANLSGADLSDAKNLTLDQLATVIVDESTILPDYIDRAALAARRRHAEPRP
jgi:uncharacterized protein YjbI with pentapeptide repeats